jgi:acyl-CoA synthetase (NDP forming)
MGTQGLEAITPDEALRARLAQLGVRDLDSPVVDLTMAATGKQYAGVLDALLESPACDAVVAVVGSSAQFHRSSPSSRSCNRNEAGNLWRRSSLRTPSARSRCSPSAASRRSALPILVAARAYFSWQGRAARLGRVECGGTAGPRSMKRRRSGSSPRSACLRSDRHRCAPRYGALAYPVAAKIHSSDIAHKTEVGGVALGIPDPGIYDEKVRTLLGSVAAALPEARIEGILVQRMESGLAEAIVGYRHDALVGPIVLVGAGGTLAEIYKDYALRLAPVNEEAAAMIASHGLAIACGYRGLPPGDVSALARAVAALSRLALLSGQPVAEAEINPLIVRREGVVAVDGFVLIKGLPSRL